MNTKLSYSEKLRSPLWQRKRLEILQRDKFTCQLCLDKETELQIHHLEYIRGNDPWEYEGHQLTTLCKDCHGYVSYDEVYPHRIIKKIWQGRVVLIAIDERGIAINNCASDPVCLSHNTLQEVIQLVINYWLLTGDDYRLTNNSIS